MPIVSNAAPGELSSPFYKKNQEICKKWEHYILDNGGEIMGEYNAWSFIMRSKIRGKRTWLLDIKKATYSNGNLLLSSKYQNLQENLIFKTRFKDIGCDKFCISRSIFKRKSQRHPFYSSVKNLLKIEINDRSLYKADYKNNELTIVIQHKNEGFDIVDRILAFDYEK